MTALRTVAAAAALVVAGFAATANAAVAKYTPSKIQINPHIKVKLCIPHYERKIVYRHHVKYLVIYFVDKRCHKHVVRVIRLGRHYAAR